MESPDVFTLLPITIDPSTKAVSSTDQRDSAFNATLQTELTRLNALHRAMIGLDTPNSVPPPPVPVKPQRSQQITKLRDAGNNSFRKGAHAEAARMYSLGIEMALGRVAWEPQGLVREEVAALYSNRAQTYMAMREWSDGLLDAEASVEMRKVGNAKAWWRKGKCLMEMGRLDEASKWLASALDFETGDKDIMDLKREVDAMLEKRRAAL